MLTRDQVRRLDRLAIEKYGLPGIVLMENAGRGAAELLAARRDPHAGPVCLCCGKGNNGGDGFVMARHLALRGLETDIIIFDDPDSFSADAGLNYEVARRLGLRLVRLRLPEDEAALEGHFARAGWIVDALLGTGAKGPLRPDYACVVARLNRSGKPVLAVDLPTGLDCDTGSITGECVQATLTATFAAVKGGFETAAGRRAAGEVIVVPIGIPVNILDREPVDSP